MSGLAGSSSEAIENHAAFIWSVADLLRGDYRQSEYGKVVLSRTVLRRFDCVLAPVKADMLARYEQLQGRVENFGPIRGEVVVAPVAVWRRLPLAPLGGRATVL